MSDTFDAGIRLKNIRVHNGKVLDVIEHSIDGATASVTVDFLNDDVALSEDFVVIGGAYSGNVFSGSKTMNVTDDIGAYAAYRINLTEIPVDDANPTFKVFAWKDMESFVPVTKEAKCGTEDKELHLILMQLGF